jgi:hypothetical protein
LNYSYENRIMNRSDNRKIESAEMNFLISMAGSNFQDFQGNTEISNQLNDHNHNMETETIN